MGSENSVLSDCEWGEEITISSDMDWKMTKAELKDETKVTVFQQKKNNKKALDLLERGTKNLKALRHPDILKYISTGENVDGSFYLVTEQVEPLEPLFPTLSPIEICAGLHSVLKALVFLHDTVGICHNNVCVSSLFVTTDGSWRLGGLEHACKFEEATSEFLEKSLAFRNSEIIAPEEEEGNIERSIEFGHVRDVYAFGVLADSVLEKLNDLGDSTKTFEPRILDECLNDDPKQRPKLIELLNDRLFRHDFLDILNFLKMVPAKTSEEKKAFFSSLTQKLVGLPEELVAKRLVVPLLSRFVVLDESAKKYMIPNLLTPYRGNRRPSCSKGQKQPILCASLFKSYVIPELYRIFHIREVHIRLVLLSQFSSYVDLFEREILEDTIVIQLLLGLRDTNDRLVAASLHALAELVPLLGADVIMGGKRKKFFTEGLPKFGSAGDGFDKSISGVIGKKTLLKDLAALSNGEITAGDGNQNKRKEKEMRRDEARRKREERKIQHRERLIKSSEKSKITEKVSCNLLDQISETEEIVVLKEHSSVSEEDNESEWDTWEGEKGINELSCDDDNHFSDEIEKELQNMPCTITSKDSSKVCPEFHTSDRKQTHSGSKLKSALKLGGKPKQQRVHFVDHNPPEVDRSAEWSHSWNNESQTFDNNTQFKSSSHSAVETVKSVPGIHPATNPNVSLGSEFDVKSIEIKAKTTRELDFFSDMAPEIKVTAVDPLTLIVRETCKLKESENAADKSCRKQGISFEVLSVPESADDTSGWGDDLDWGTEDF